LNQKKKFDLPPNALSSFEHIRTLLEGKRPVVFLDYDGTLAPIVSRPDQAFMTDTMRAAVKTVAQKFTTAVVSGRSTQKVVNFVKLDDLFYAGSHGLDITGPNWPANEKKVSGDSAAAAAAAVAVAAASAAPPVKHRVAQKFVPVLESCRDRILLSIESVLGTESNVEIEDNVLTFSVHYRNAVGCTAKQVRTIIDDVLLEKEYQDQLVCTAGKMVYEIRPQVQWNKGTAVLWLLETLGMRAVEDDVVALYLGDDVTDEDAFRALSETWKGKCASIVIQGESDCVECVEKGVVGYMGRPTSALWSLKDTVEVQHFLTMLSAV
jgi:trehalose 6-phosphate phosphatase